MSGENPEKTHLGKCKYYLENIHYFLLLCAYRMHEVTRNVQIIGAQVHACILWQNVIGTSRVIDNLFDRYFFSSLPTRNVFVTCSGARAQFLPSGGENGGLVEILAKSFLSISMSWLFSSSPTKLFWIQVANQEQESEGSEMINYDQFQVMYRN